MWFVFALLSAVFAALTSVLAKVGIEGVNSNLATALRTCVVLAMAWLMVFITHTQSGIGSIGRKSWVFLILSGLATGASWLCYYKAIQMGSVSKVAPIDKLSVVIDNLLSNAIDFSPPQGVVRIEAEVVARRLCVSCIDQGPGIAAEDAERIFQPFVQVC